MSRVVILMYHIVAQPRSASEARYCCTPERFEAHMMHVARCGVPLLPLERIADALDGLAEWPASGLAVTFDDGFADTFENALPVLSRLRIPATMFALSDRLGARNEWMTARGFPARQLASPAQLREMAAAGVSIGSHTRTHPRLPDLAPGAKRVEIRGSREALEQLLGQPVTTFAYPYGLFDDDARAAVAEAGYRSACSTRSGFNGPSADRFLLRRIEVFGGDSVRQLRQKIKFGANEVGVLYPARYYAGRLASRLGL